MSDGLRATNVANLCFLQIFLVQLTDNLVCLLLDFNAEARRIAESCSTSCLCVPPRTPRFKLISH